MYMYNYVQIRCTCLIMYISTVIRCTCIIMYISTVIWEDPFFIQGTEIGGHSKIVNCMQKHKYSFYSVLSLVCMILRILEFFSIGKFVKCNFLSKKNNILLSVLKSNGCTCYLSMKRFEETHL